MDEQTSTEAETPRPSKPRFPSRGIDPLGALRRYGRIGLGVGAVISVAGLGFAIIKGKPVYYTEAALQVARSFAKNLESDDELSFNSNSDYLQFVQHQTREVASYSVAVAALEKLGSDASLWILPEESPRRAAERLQASLQVRAVPDTYLITVGLEDAQSEGLSTIVNTVVAAYLEKQKAAEIEDPVARRDQLAQHRNDTLARMHQSTETLAAMAQELGVTSFEEKFLNPYDNLLKNGAEALAIARRRRIEAEAKTGAQQAHIERLKDASLEGSAERFAAGDPEVSASKSFLGRRRAELVLELAKLAAAHPGRAAITAEMADIDAEIARVGSAALADARQMLRRERVAELEQQRSKLQATADEARGVEVNLGQEVAQQGERVAWFASRYTEALNLKRQIERDRKRLEQIEDRVQFLTLEAAAPGFVRVASAARDPLLPSRGGRRMLLGIFLVGALAVGLLIPIAIDRFDPRLHAPEELASVLGFAPLGWLPRQASEFSQLLAADRKRRLALALDAESTSETLRTIVLSPVSLAVDAGALALDVERALRAVGRSATAWSLDAAGQLHRLSHAGNSTPGEAQAVLSPNDLRRILAETVQSQELALVATQPFGTSSSAELAIRVADAALLLVGASHDTCSSVAAAAATLERLDPGAAGALLLDVRVDGPDAHATQLLDPMHGEVRPAGLMRWLWAA